MRRRVVFLMMCLWCLFLVYLGAQSWEALKVSLVLAPPFFILTYYAFKSRNLLLRIFMAMSFVAHAIGAPFFFLYKDNYSYSGWGAVKNFDFELVHFVEMYFVVLLCLTAIVAFSELLDRVVMYLPYGSRRVLPKENVLRRVGPALTAVGKNATRAYGLWLVSFVVLVGIPLNWFMYANRIGILGLVSEALPFRLTGILYYSRLYIVPLILYWLYTRSSRSTLIILSVVAYALFSGFSSASRTVLVLSLLPILFGFFLEKKYVRLGVMAAVALVGFFLVSASRDSSYQEFAVGYDEMIVAAIGGLFDDERISFVPMIGQIANRLYGAQDIVLAYQYDEVSDPWLALARYFSSGGVASAVVSDLNRDFYGLEFEEGSGFGVGIGVIAYLVILGHSSVARLLVGSFLVALLLSIGNRIIQYTSRRVFGRETDPVTYFVALIVTFSLYSSSINFFVWQILFVVIATITLEVARRIRHWLPEALSAYGTGSRSQS